jgi:hypothetical protein
MNAPYADQMRKATGIMPDWPCLLNDRPTVGCWRVHDGDSSQRSLGPFLLARLSMTK